MVSSASYVSIFASVILAPLSLSWGFRNFPASAKVGISAGAPKIWRNEFKRFCSPTRAAGRGGAVTASYVIDSRRPSARPRPLISFEMHA